MSSTVVALKPRTRIEAIPASTNFRLVSGHSVITFLFNIQTSWYVTRLQEFVKSFCTKPCTPATIQQPRSESPNFAKPEKGNHYFLREHALQRVRRHGRGLCRPTDARKGLGRSRNAPPPPNRR